MRWIPLHQQACGYESKVKTCQSKIDFVVNSDIQYKIKCRHQGSEFDPELYRVTVRPEVCTFVRSSGSLVVSYCI